LKKKRKLVPKALCCVGLHRLVEPPESIRKRWPQRYCVRSGCSYVEEAKVEVEAEVKEAIRKAPRLSIGRLVPPVTKRTNAEVECEICGQMTHILVRTTNDPFPGVTDLIWSEEPGSYCECWLDLPEGPVRTAYLKRMEDSAHDQHHGG
jgi:hypothetical protein